MDGIGKHIKVLWPDATVSPGHSLKRRLEMRTVMSMPSDLGMRSTGD